MSRKFCIGLAAVCLGLLALALALSTTRHSSHASPSLPRVSVTHTHRLGGGAVRPVLSGLFGGNPSAPVVGNSFTSSTGTWLNTPVSYFYQWDDCDGSGNNCVPITGATSNSYTVVSGDIGFTLRATVGACNAYGCVNPSAASTSAATGLVAAANVVPSNATPPVVTGIPVQGQVLTSSTGTWSGAPSSYAYQWEDCDSAGANCSNIGGATSSTYTLASGDNGSTIEVAVKATNGTGQSATAATSTATNVAAPSTLGKTAVGSVCTDGLAANFERVNEYALASNSTVDSINAYLAPSGTVGSQTIEGIIYADNGSSAPGAFVAAGRPITFTNNNATGWYSLPFTPTTLAAGNYWIGLFTGNSTGVIDYCYDIGSGNLRAGLSRTFTSGPADPFGAASFNSFVFSTYLGYAAGAQGTPTSPTNLAATAGDGTVSLTWTASTETGGTIDHYAISRSTSQNSGFSQIATSNTTSYTDNTPTNGTTYYYYVKAVDGSSVSSGQSNTVSAAPQSQSTPLWSPTLNPTCGGSTYWQSINPSVGNTTGGTVDTCVTDPAPSGSVKVIQQTVTSGTLGYSSKPRIDWNGVGVVPFDGTGDVYISIPVYIPANFPCSQTSSSGSYINLFKEFGQPASGAGPLTLAAAESSTACSTWAIEGNTSGSSGGGASLLYTSSATVNDATWHDWIFHIVLNASASTGELQAWEDGSAITFNRCNNVSGKLSGCGTSTLHYTTLIPNGNNTGLNYANVENARTNTSATFTDTAYFGAPAIAHTYVSAQNTLTSYPNGP